MLSFKIPSGQISDPDQKISRPMAYLHLFLTCKWLNQNGLTPNSENSHLHNSISENKQFQYGIIKFNFSQGLLVIILILILVILRLTLRIILILIDIGLTFRNNITKVCFSSKKNLCALACVPFFMILIE